MQTKLVHDNDKRFTDHPKFKGVSIAVLVKSEDTAAVSVSQLVIEPGIAIPVHTHDPQIDSILVVAGHGEGYINGDWQEIGPGDYLFVPAEVEHGIRNTGDAPLVLFVHHSPPLI